LVKFMEFLTGIDRAIFYFVNNRLHNPVLDVIMQTLTNQWIWLPPLALLALYLLVKGGKKTKITVTLCIVAVALTDAFCYRILKPFFERIRPFESIPHVLQLAGAAGYSFPSNHAANTFAAATVVTFFNRKAGVWFLGLAFLISFSRVYCGVHYPLDVFGGAAIGAAIGFLTVFFYRNFEWKKEPKKRF